MPRISSPCIALCVLGLLLVPDHSANAQQALSLHASGTLSCTTVVSAPPSPSEIALSCAFEPVSGTTRSYKGLMRRRGDRDFPPGKRVLIWSVLAPTIPLQPAELAGLYVGQTGGHGAKRLVGGAGNNIVLDPVTSSSQIGGEAMATLLDLRLTLTKT